MLTPTMPIALSVVCCPVGRHRIQVITGLGPEATTTYMQPERFVDLDGPHWYPTVAALSDNAGAREDDAGLYWLSKTAALSALAAAKGRLPAPVPLWLRGRGDLTTPAEILARARAALGQHVVLGAEKPSPDIAAYGFVARIEILGGASMELVAHLLHGDGMVAWSLRPVLNMAGEITDLPMLGHGVR